MKLIFKSIINAIGWKRALAMVWDLCDDAIKKEVSESPNKVDDEAFKVLDLVIKKLTSEELEAA